MMNRNNKKDNETVQQVEIPLFKTEEGRYLAISLGDPLIKGLTEVANNRPEDPITFLANYLYNFSNTKRNQIEEKQNETNKLEQNNNILNKKESEMIVIETNGDYPPSSDGPESALTSEDRDEHGQSMLHFACARSHGKNSLIHLIEESGTSITYRDELYRTARDVSLQANLPDNSKEIDRYVMSLAARGDLESFSNMLIEGYDHIMDVIDAEGITIHEIVRSRRHTELIKFLESVREFEELRENFHNAIRIGNINEVKEIASRPDGAKIVRAKNYYGRCAFHIAVLKENEEIVEFLASNFKQALRIGDNLERTALHYAMGVTSVEVISRILIKNGAKRVLKDLKGRQPTYYFMNKADILRLQEEEDQ